jgi:hypothetical protein
VPPDSSQPDFKDASAKGPSTLDLQRFQTAVSANDVKGVLSFVMAWPKEASTSKSNEGMTALMFAAREGFKETAWLLIHAKCDLEIGNQNDSTALMFAAHAGKASIVAMLLEAGANVNHINKGGRTPLMSAASQGFKNTVQQLLKFNADITPTDEDGNSAQTYAHENEFFEIEDMIKVAGATQQATREKEAAAAKAKAEAENRPVITDDNGESLRDLEKRMMKAKLTYPGIKTDDGADSDEKRSEQSGNDARQVLKDIQKKMDKDGPMF